MAKEFIIYVDESTNKGEFYSNFYGGALIQSSNLDDTFFLENMSYDMSILKLPEKTREE